MTHPLANRHAVICGSSQGIGRACAEELARLGATCTLLARNEASLKKVVAELASGAGQRHDFRVADFADWKALGAIAERIVTERGPVHLLINNTGGPPAGPASEAEPEAYLDAAQKHIACNQVLTRAFVPGMKDAGFGRIVNIISTSVITPIKGLGVSNTIRGAVANWGRTIAAELGPFGITVNNVLPGFTHTGRLDTLIAGKAERGGIGEDEVQRQMLSTVPVGRFGKPEELGATVGFLCSPIAGYINGVNLPVDGGRLAAQ